MASLEDYAAYVAAVDRGGLTSAARSLGRSLQSVSRSVQAVESEVGARLIVRTTRRSAPTPAGLKLRDRLSAALDAIAAAREEATRGAAEISGSLRVGASSHFGVSHVLPVVRDFMAMHPRVEVEMVLDDAAGDLIVQGIDLAVRAGDLAPSSLKTRSLGRLRRVVYAAPGYLARHGRPKAPADLSRHACVLRGREKPNGVWRFGQGPAAIAVPVRGAFRSDSAAARLAAVRAGLGIGLAPLFHVRPSIEAGEVELLLPDAPAIWAPVQVVWLPGRAVPARARALIDFLRARLRVDDP